MAVLFLVLVLRNGEERENFADGKDGVFFANTQSWSSYVRVTVASERQLIEQKFGEGASGDVPLLLELLDDYLTMSFNTAEEIWSQYERTLLRDRYFFDNFIQNRILIIRENVVHFKPYFVMGLDNFYVRSNISYLNGRYEFKSPSGGVLFPTFTYASFVEGNGYLLLTLGVGEVRETIQIFRNNNYNFIEMSVSMPGGAYIRPYNSDGAHLTFGTFSPDGTSHRIYQNIYGEYQYIETVYSYENRVIYVLNSDNLINGENNFRFITNGTFNLTFFEDYNLYFSGDSESRYFSFKFQKVQLGGPTNFRLSSGGSTLSWNPSSRETFPFFRSRAYIKRAGEETFSLINEFAIVSLQLLGLQHGDERHPFTEGINTIKIVEELVFDYSFQMGILTRHIAPQAATFDINVSFGQRQKPYDIILAQSIPLNREIVSWSGIEGSGFRLYSRHESEHYFRQWWPSFPTRASLGLDTVHYLATGKHTFKIIHSFHPNMPFTVDGNNLKIYRDSEPAFFCLHIEVRQVPPPKNLRVEGGFLRWDIPEHVTIGGYELWRKRPGSNEFERFAWGGSSGNVFVQNPLEFFYDISVLKIVHGTGSFIPVILVDGVFIIYRIYSYAYFEIDFL
ncbi:MAG: hypothetical protein FWE22_06800 [Firmicutes bacterium]|nr:hypothetical protein [Bacillota bacterium]